MTTATSDSKSGEYQGITSDGLISKLRRSLARDGDFPASAKVVNELRLLTSDPKTTGNQVTEVILREPSLGTRILHVVNSSFYRRGRPIMTVSQAVVQIGMKPLSELCSGLILLRRFIPVARRGGPFASGLQRSVLTSLLASSISSEMDKNKKDERGYLAGSFIEIGSLLLAYYFPKLFEAAAKRAAQKNQDISKSIHELTGLTPADISLEVMNELKLPEFYTQVIQTTQELDSGKHMGGSDKNSEVTPQVFNTARALFAAREISRVVVSSKNQSDLDDIVKTIVTKAGVDPQIIGAALGKLPEMFKNHCSAIELRLPALPEFVSTYTPDKNGSAPEEHDGELNDSDTFNQFVDEIRQAVENREPTASIITSVMETMAWSLAFDRVLLMLLTRNKKSLQGRMFLGNMENFNPQEVIRELGDRAGIYDPDSIAFAEARPVFNGDPILEDGWPLAAIPIGFGTRAIGVIYADRVNSDVDELNGKEQAAIGVLAELLDRSIGINSD